ncbi:MAG: hypothetical protein JW884_12390, partial [Deltaproteobacteria bacterium]|nr:hypothetical protein [Deltaproteobacteria bacterium]
STGKEGKGILPVVGESPARPEDYDDDRIFVALGVDDRTMSFLEKLAAEGHPVFRMGLNGAGDLGEQFFLWEMATAAAGHVLAINPFDQPNVESAKIQTKEAVALFKKTGKLPGDAPLCSEGSLTFYGNVIGAEPKEIIGALLKKATAGSYVALQAYLNPADSIDDALSVLRNGLRDRLRKAVTLGYGPRFLHSTGQLHKGDGGKGLFIQITADDREDRPIPDEPGSQASSLSFGVLKAAQAMGDCRALVAGGRTVVRVHISGDTEEGLEALGKIVLSV